MHYTRQFVDLVVAALRATGDARWGHYRLSGEIATGAVAHYVGDGDPVDGSEDIVGIGIVQGLDPAFPSWTPLGDEGGEWAS